MARKKLLAVAVGMLMPAVAQALTLNQIKVGSLLDQPLKAAIEVTADRTEELDSLRVGLAPPRRFTEKGIPRPDMLEDLQFQVVRKEPGKALVIVTTKTPVREPFLDFLVEATWQSGQVMREYTVLLDPPFTVGRRPPPIEVPAKVEPPKPVAAAPAPPEAIETKPGERTAQQTAAPATQKKPAEKVPEKPAAPPVAHAPSGEGPVAGRLEVAEGDTLWSLAKSVRPTGASVYQTLNAIFLANPHAFLEDNVNLMLEGSILRVPPREEILALDARAAERLLAEHTRAWRPGTPVSAGSGDAKSAAATASPRQQPADAGKADAELRLASAGTSSSVTEAGDATRRSADAESNAEGAAGKTGELAQQLVLAREEAASVRQEAEDLRSRLADMSAQLEDARRLLELKDEQLARLQAYYAAQGEEQDQPVTEAETVPDDVIAAETIDRGPGPIESPDTEAAPEAAADQVPTEPAGDEGATASLSGATEDARAVAETAEAPDTSAELAEPTTPAEGTVPAEPAEPAEAERTRPVAEGAAETSDAAAEPPEPSKAAEAAPRQTTSPGLSLDDVPILPVLGGVAVAGLLGLLVLLRRRRGGEAEGPLPASGSSPAATLVSRTAQPSVATRLAEVDDLVAASDLGGAAVVAEKLLASNPGQPQIALKLFEIHHASGDGKAFAALARKLAATGFAADYTDAWTRVEEMGRELMPGDRLFAPAASAAPVAADAPSAEGDRDLDEMLDSLETELSGREGSLREEAAEALGEAAAHLDADREPAPPAPEVAASSTAQPAPSDAEAEPDETLEFERVELAPEEVVDVEAAAADYEGAIEFDLDSLEQLAATEAADASAETAGDETKSDLEDAFDTLEFTLPAGEAEAAGEELTGGLDDLAESLESTPLTSGDEAELADESGSGDVDNIVSLRPEEPLAPEAVAASDEDEVQTKLDLARAFLDLGDAEGARSILEEVVAEGNERQREEAESLLSNTG